MKNGKTAVVTGASSGIGAALCRRLAGEGWNLVLVNRDAQKAARQEAELKEAFPDLSVESRTADLADQDSVLRACRNIASRHEGIDALFLNAGVLLPSLVYSRHDNEMHFEVNTVAPFLFTHALAGSLGAAGGTVVVSGSSARRMVPRLAVTELRSPPSFSPMGPYARSKQAVTLAFSEMAADFQRRGIRLRVVDLGPTKTAMAQGDGLPALMRAFSFLFGSPERAAEALYRGLDSPAPRAASQPGLLDLLESMPGYRALALAQ